jgi:hypothetical protein
MFWLAYFLVLIVFGPVALVVRALRSLRRRSTYTSRRLARP